MARKEDNNSNSTGERKRDSGGRFTSGGDSGLRGGAQGESSQGSQQGSSAGKSGGMKDKSSGGDNKRSSR